MNKQSLAKLFEEVYEKYELDGYSGLPAERKLHPHSQICAILIAYGLVKDPGDFRIVVHEHMLVSLARAEDLREDVTLDDCRSLNAAGAFYDADEDLLLLSVDGK